jgi:hypothetical protein
MKHALRCQSRYGIFQKFLHRNLLWRVGDSQLQEIQYDSPLPSWTWMVYSGGVKFIDVGFGKMEWIDSLRFDEKREEAIIASLWAFRDCTLVRCGSYHEVRCPNGATKGRIDYDVSGGDIFSKESCVIVGKESFNFSERDSASTYHMLVVRPTDVNGEYRRVGAGTIFCCHVVKQKANVRVV